MAKKANTIYIKLESTGINPKTGKKTGHFYTTTKNTKGEKASVKQERMKYDPVIRQHVMHTEKKIKSSK